ncbi:MAG: L-threonylcarbamoyladenylate synthase, partial [Actinomycetota bacterium]
FGSVSPTTAKDVEVELGQYLGKEDVIIDGGPCEVGVESTIIDCTGKLPRILRLGAVTEAMINEISLIDKDDNLSEIRASGSLSRHYSPRAKVFRDREPNKGEGFIALSKIQTPDGVIRLSAPDSIEEYARTLYSSLRSADTQGLRAVIAVIPEGDGLAAAIRDRILRASAE